LQYSRARFYDAKLGRFISEDPIGFRGGDVNLFGYVGGNPLRFRDPSGKLPEFLETFGKWLKSWFYTPETECYIVNTNESVTKKSTVFEKHFDVTFGGTNVGNDYVVVQWLKGSGKKNGQFLTTTRYGKPAPTNYPDWEVDSTDDDPASGTARTAPDGSGLHHFDNPGSRGGKSGDSFEFNFQFQTNLYRRDQVNGLSSMKSPTDPAPVLSVPWNFVDSYVIP
jgi:uncharacterized protein RhaS with RHS repeats